MTVAGPPMLMAPELREAVREELRAGERVVWAGQPRPWAYARQTRRLFQWGLGAAGFGITWTAITFTAAAGSSTDPAWLRVAFPLFGVPLVVLGTVLALLPLAARRNATRTAYVVTDRRAIMIEGTLLGMREVRSFGPAMLRRMHRQTHRDGTGDVIFHEYEKQAFFASGGDGHEHEPQYVRVSLGFIGVADPAAVESLIRRTLRLDDAPAAPVAPARDPGAAAGSTRAVVMAPHFEEAARAELRTGERLVWLGDPRPAVLARRAYPYLLFGLVAFAFTLVFAGAMVAGQAGAQTPAAPAAAGGAGGADQDGGWWDAAGLWVAAVVLGVFMLVSLWLMAWPLVVWRRARRLAYALTDQRALVIELGLLGGRTVRSFSPDDLVEMYRRQRPDGSGDIIFRNQRQPFGGNDGACVHGGMVGFLGIPAVRRMDRLVRDTLRVG